MGLVRLDPIINGEVAGDGHPSDRRRLAIGEQDPRDCDRAAILQLERRSPAGMASGLRAIGSEHIIMNPTGWIFHRAGSQVCASSGGAQTFRKIQGLTIVSANAFSSFEQRGKTYRACCCGQPTSTRNPSPHFTGGEVFRASVQPVIHSWTTKGSAQ